MNTFEKIQQRSIVRSPDAAGGSLTALESKIKSVAKVIRLKPQMKAEKMQEVKQQIQEHLHNSKKLSELELLVTLIENLQSEPEAQEIANSLFDDKCEEFKKMGRTIKALGYDEASRTKIKTPEIISKPAGNEIKLSVTEAQLESLISLLNLGDNQLKKLSTKEYWDENIKMQNIFQDELMKRSFTTGPTRAEIAARDFFTVNLGGLMKIDQILMEIKRFRSLLDRQNLDPAEKQPREELVNKFYEAFSIIHSEIDRFSPKISPDQLAA